MASILFFPTPRHQVDERRSPSNSEDTSETLVEEFRQRSIGRVTKIAEVLRSSPEGEELREFYGIDPNSPRHAPTEADEIRRLFKALGEAPDERRRIEAVESIMDYLPLPPSPDAALRGVRFPRK